MSSIAATTDSVRTWRDRYKVHPCADVFPMMADAELQQLVDDIKARGQQQPIVQWRDGTGDWLVIDGRNRLEACARIACDPRIVEWQGDDPAAYVISANIKRRHLTKEQQAELIVRTIEASTPNDPATPARSFSPKPGKKGGSTKDPLKQKAVEEGRKHGISPRTMQKGRAKVQGKVPTQPAKTKATKTKITTPTAEPTTTPAAAKTTAWKKPATDITPLEPPLERLAKQLADIIVQGRWTEVWDRSWQLADMRRPEQGKEQAAS